MSFLPVFANGFARSGGGSDRIPWNRAENQQNPMTYTRNNVNQYTDTAYPTESFTYDDDGNLTADGTYTYVWDAENRLTEVRATSPEAGSKKLVFAYDYMNRRVCKQLFTWNTGTSDWNTTPASDKRFVYDGWNVVLWLNGLSDNAVARKYTWGLDLSGLAGDGSVSGIHGAGGIGGLLAHQSSTGTSNFWYLYDGNGNVCQILTVRTCRTCPGRRRAISSTTPTATSSTPAG